MRVYHRRSSAIEGALDTRDEEDCYSAAAGLRRGLFLTAESLRGPRVLSAEIPDGDLRDFEVTGPDDTHRTFVVPSKAVTGITFAAASPH